MAVLQKGKASYPFWGTSIKLITGLDPLSLQTTSEAIYATMLPGISNLTNRLRYYGFYCWLLDFYFKREKKGNSTEQFRFIRRAELMIAILMQSEKKDVLQITGSTFANNLINNQTGKFFDLAAGADQDDADKEVYWKYPSGAFGQYYYGAMRALSLVVAVTNTDGDMMYKITDPDARQQVCGSELANAFNKSLSPEIQDLFYKNIKKGRLNANDIPELIRNFSIDKVNATTSEWQLYAAMLMDKDEPGQEVEEHFSFHRRETITELIKVALENNGSYDWYKFLLKSYALKPGSGSNESNTLRGWYAYQFNEYYQYACGAIFWATLLHLYSFQQDQYLPTFVNKLAKAITKALCKSLNNITPGHTLENILSSIPPDYDEEFLYDEIGKYGEQPIEAGKYGFLLLFRLFIENREHLHATKEFMSRKDMIREGNMIDGLLSFSGAEADQIEAFIEQFLLRRIIYRHQMVALRKMGNGTQSTHKFIIEDQYIRFIDTFPPRATSPRMIALFNLLSDLKLVNEEGILTSLHKKIMAD